MRTGDVPPSLKGLRLSDSARPRGRPSRTDIVAAALALLTIAASRGIANSVFEELPHLEDEFAVLWQAEVMAAGRISMPSPPEPESFLVPFVVDHGGVRFGKYPPGWPAILSVGARLGFPYWVNPILAGIAVWLTYRLGSRLAGGRAGILAAFLTATSPMLLMLSGGLMPHMLSVTMALGFSLAWFDLFAGDGVRRSALRRRPILRMLAGGSLGVLAITRPLTALAVGLPFAIHAVVLLIRRRARIGRDLTSIAAVALGILLVLPLWNAALTGSAFVNPYTLYWPYDRIGFGPGIGVLEGGHTLRQAWINTRHSLWAWQHDLFGWPFLSWILIPLGVWPMRRRAEAWICLGVFVSLAAGYLTYWVGSWLLGPRYFVEALPGLAAVSACGVVWAGGRMGEGDRGIRLRRLVVTGTVSLLLAANLLVYLPIRVGGLRGLFGIDRGALEAFARVNPGRALVIVRRDPQWHGYGNLLPLAAPFAESELLLAYERGPEIDLEVAARFPDRPVFVYDPVAPGVLAPFRR